MNPTLSIVTGTRNRPASLQRLVESIQKHTGDWELIVSDASDGLLAVREIPKRVHVINEYPRLGCSAGYNRAFRMVRGEWVIWLNDDCSVMPGYAETAIAFMKEHPEIGLGALYYSDPNHDGFKVNLCNFGMLYANFGILRRELGNEIGWFDERIRMYGCDNSLSYRVLMAGKGIAAITGARIIHHSENDDERKANNDMPFRYAQSDLLRELYAPFLPEMRKVYESCSVVEVNQ